jgi:hypothetical protein
VAKKATTHHFVAIQSRHRERRVTEATRISAICELLAEALRRGRTVRIRAQGTSMLPALWPGDVLTVAPATDIALTPGAIALTVHGERLVAHRVMQRIGSGGAVSLITRGDALEHGDPPVPAARVLGIVVARNGRPLADTGRIRCRALGHLAGLAVRSASLLALTLKLRALIWKTRALRRRVLPAVV